MLNNFAFIQVSKVVKSKIIWGTNEEWHFYEGKITSASFDYEQWFSLHTQSLYFFLSVFLSLSISFPLYFFLFVFHFLFQLNELNIVKHRIYFKLILIHLFPCKLSLVKTTQFKNICIQVLFSWREVTEERSLFPTCMRITHQNIPLSNSLSHPLSMIDR